ncbi:MAG: GGDEF domain-containing protein [Bacillota bacterium]
MPGFDFKLTKFFNRLRKPLISYERLMEDSQAPGLLKEGHWVAMLYLDVTGFELAEQINSSLSYKQVSQTLTHLARLHAPGCLKNYHIFEQRRWGDDLVIYFYAPNQSPPSAMELSELADSVRVDLGARLNKKYSHLIPAPLGFHIGYALLNPHAGSIEKILYTAFKEAVMVSKGHLNAYELQRQQEYKELLQNKNVNIVYQPIVGLVTGGIMGYEALSRGPADTFFANPENLFSYAEKTNQLFVLEKLAREKAMFHFGENILKHKLFININPMVVHDRSFIADDIKAALSELGASPDQVVFEITERTNIENFNAFRKSLQYYRQHGFLVAIDDAGSGYSSLQAILELQPDFIKIDLSLIRDIDKIRNKQVLVETFVAFSEKTGSQIIAEGIENQNELSCLQELGVPLGQGFFLAHPGYPPPVLYAPAARQLKEYTAGSNHRERLGRMVPVGSISQEVATFTSCALTREILDFFTRYHQVEGIAILEHQKPVGLVMRDKLFNQLGSQYGFAIYAERPISLVMDRNPLRIEDDTPVESVSQAALGRPDHKVYDSIIINKNGLYKGLVSLRSLLDVITSMQVEGARFANPLTGLPGNRQIEEELLNRLASGRPFSVIYLDLDHFKGFNDCYGFERGDLVLKLTAEICKESSYRAGEANDLVGHIGGDDFIIITRPAVSSKICEFVIAGFDLEVPDFYDPEDRQRGYINTRDRQDKPVQLPLMSISLALIDCEPGQFRAIEELSRAAASLKKYAKSKEGSVYVKDRRKWD